MSRKIDLCLHAGGYKVTEADVKKVETPQASDTWHPIPHHLLIDEVYESVLDSGYRIVHDVHALANNGLRYFGMIQVEREDAKGDSDSTLVVGLRNSHDKRFPAALAVGNGVFVCDNLCFSGEIRLGRKHTKNIVRDLPGVVRKAVGKLGAARHSQEVRMAHYKQHEFSRLEAHDLVIQALDARVIPSSRIVKVLEQWRDPNHPEFAKDGNTAWRLYNAFTEVMKQTAVMSLPQTSIKLHGILDTATGLAALTSAEAKREAEEVKALGATAAVDVA